jgi:hypothetical protein
MQIPANAPPKYGSGITDINLPKQTTPTQEPEGDTVQLSPYAKAMQLKEQGASNSVIGAQLGMDPKTVENYFGTPTAAAATTPQPTNFTQEVIQNTAAKAQEATPAKK